MKSKIWAIVRAIACLAATVFVIYVAFFQPNNALLKILSIAALAVAVFAHGLAMCCPHCGSFLTLPCHLFSKTCGRCRKCGELVHWKESLEVDI